MFDHIKITNNTKGPIAVIHSVDPHTFDRPVDLDGRATLLLAGETVCFFQNMGVGYVIHHPDSRIKQLKIDKRVLKDGTVRTDIKDVTRDFDFETAVAERLARDAEAEKGQP